METMSINTRKEAFDNIHIEIARFAKGISSLEIERTINARAFLPEYLFYSNFGRADLIKFKCWNDARHGEPLTPDIALRELPTRKNASLKPKSDRSQDVRL
jgi:hypothetical protein